MKRSNKSLVKIGIDTNVWISFLMGKTLARLESYIYNGHFQIVTCAEQLSELQDVLYRPKMERYFSKQQIKGVFELLADYALLINVFSKVDICRDAKDNYLLSLAIDAKIDFLITGDKDLLSLQQIETTKIINFKDFENIFLYN
ncbi:MAG: putative toxin-antitoxin system toxin component, PIN family [Bacteroidetes bacterium]|nr:putative toxin-antitoxin system toxin component, PIN family [Bacteroidota bacterium]